MLIVSCSYLLQYIVSLRSNWSKNTRQWQCLTVNFRSCNSSENFNYQMTTFLYYLLCCHLQLSLGTKKDKMFWNAVFYMYVIPPKKFSIFSEFFNLFTDLLKSESLLLRKREWHLTFESWFCCYKMLLRPIGSKILPSFFRRG